MIEDMTALRSLQSLEFQKVDLGEWKQLLIEQEIVLSRLGIGFIYRDYRKIELHNTYLCSQSASPIGN
jgi:hypothetical protein